MIYIDIGVSCDLTCEDCIDFLKNHIAHYILTALSVQNLTDKSGQYIKDDTAVTEDPVSYDEDKQSNVHIDCECKIKELKETIKLLSYSSSTINSNSNNSNNNTSSNSSIKELDTDDIY